MTQPRRRALFDRTPQAHGRRASEFIRIRRANLQGFVCIGSPYKAFTDERKWNESSTERAFSVYGTLKYTAGELGGLAFVALRYARSSRIRHKRHPSRRRRAPAIYFVSRLSRLRFALVKVTVFCVRQPAALVPRCSLSSAKAFGTLFCWAATDQVSL
jgi:hypothetical protein